MFDPETDIGGPAEGFPPTRASAVLGAASRNPEVRARAQADLVAAYWKPIYKYLRMKWRVSNEAAKDLTQGFFADAFERGLFQRFDPRKAALRTYVRTCVDGFAANTWKAARTQKRGGEHRPFSLDFEEAENECRLLASSGSDDPDQLFEREWIRSLFSQSIQTLRQTCTKAGRPLHFRLFERYDLEGGEALEHPTYEQLAAEFGLTVTQVTNALSWTRRTLRAIVLDRLRDLCATADDFRDEVGKLFGKDAH
jgi:RNA polymerase sigma factor (sigma-70 family)